MVTIGFICEGITDFYFLNSTSFKVYLESINVISIPTKIIQGSGNLKNKNKLKTHLEILFKRGADFVVVLTDLDDDVCISKTKEAIDTGIDKQITIIAIKELEAWILADESNMSSFLESSFKIDAPESLIDPKKEMIEICKNKFSPKIITETKVFNTLIDNGFSIENAANHPNCPSAKYFINKLKSLNQ